MGLFGGWLIWVISFFGGILVSGDVARRPVASSIGEKGYLSPKNILFLRWKSCSLSINAIGNGFSLHFRDH